MTTETLRDLPSIQRFLDDLGYTANWSSGIKTYIKEWSPALKVVYSAEMGACGIFAATYNGPYTADTQVKLPYLGVYGRPRPSPAPAVEPQFGMMFPREVYDGCGGPIVRWGVK
jgi:hypothetical protein